MKKLLAFILMTVMLLTLFAGCNKDSDATAPTTPSSATDSNPTGENPTSPSAPDNTEPTTPSTPDSAQPSVPTAPEGKDTVTVYASVPSDWTTPYCWAWSGENNAFDAWPGVAMTENGEWYTIEVPNWVENVIISNNGTPQTQDLAVVMGDNTWIVVNSSAIGTAYDSNPSLSQSTEFQLESMLNSELDKLLSSMGGIIDTSAFERQIGQSKTGDDWDRVSTLKARHGDASITSAKLDQHEFIGAAVTVKQLMAEGWSYNGSNSNVGSHIIGLAYCYTPTGKMAEIGGLNNTNEPLPFLDCVVAGFEINYNMAPLYDPADVAQSYINGALITKDTTLTQFLSSVGCPSGIQITQFVKDGEYTGSSVFLTYDNLTAVFNTSEDTATLEKITLGL